VRVEATNQAGGLREINKQYRAYRLAQVAKAERATSYAAFVEQRYTVTIVRSVASMSRMI
jgi:Na+/proline symporter